MVDLFLQLGGLSGDDLVVRQILLCDGLRLRQLPGLLLRHGAGERLAVIGGGGRFQAAEGVVHTLVFVQQEDQRIGHDDALRPVGDDGALIRRLRILRGLTGGVGRSGPLCLRVFRFSGSLFIDEPDGVRLFVDQRGLLLRILRGGGDILAGGGGDDDGPGVQHLIPLRQGHTPGEVSGDIVGEHYLRVGDLVALGQVIGPQGGLGIGLGLRQCFRIEGRQLLILRFYTAAGQRKGQCQHRQKGGNGPQSPPVSSVNMHEDMPPSVVPGRIFQRPANAVGFTIPRPPVFFHRFSRKTAPKAAFFTVLFLDSTAILCDTY